MFNQLELCVCVSETRVECADRFVYIFARMHYLYGNWLVFSTNMRSGFSWIDHFEMEAWRWKKSEANIVHDPSVFIFLSSLSSLLNIPASKEKKLAEMKRNENGWMQNPSSWIETLQRSKSTRKYSATLHSYKWWQKFDLIYLFDVCGLCDFVCASFFLVALQLQELKRQFADGTCKRVQCNVRGFDGFRSNWAIPNEMSHIDNYIADDCKEPASKLRSFVSQAMRKMANDWTSKVSTNSNNLTRHN